MTKIDSLKWTLDTLHGAFVLNNLRINATQSSADSSSKSASSILSFFFGPLPGIARTSLRLIFNICALHHQ